MGGAGCPLVLISQRLPRSRRKLPVAQESRTGNSESTRGFLAVQEVFVERSELYSYRCISIEASVKAIKRSWEQPAYQRGFGDATHGENHRARARWNVV